MKKNCYYFLLITFIFLAVGGFCFARKLEIKIPGLPTNPTLIDYRNVLFNFLVGLGAGLAILSLIIGAIQLMASAGSPEASGNAKKRIIGSVLGLILLFSSYLIMKTINPKLISSQPIGQLPVPPGIFLTDGKTETPCPESVADISKLPTGFNKIVYKCAEGVTPEKQSILWVRKFPEIDLGDWANGTVDEIKCGSTASIANAKSFMLDRERPGLYLYNKTGASASGSRSMQILSSQTEMDDLYKKNTKSYEIINDPDNKTYYGVIFHTEKDFQGLCRGVASVEKYVFKDLPSGFSPYSFEFFQWNADDWKTSGDGVSFYSRPNGWMVGAGAGYYMLPASEIKARIRISWAKTAEILKFSYEGIAGVTEEEIKLCETFFNCPGSIKVKGNYLVYLSTVTDPENEVGYCQTLYPYAASNLETSWLLNPEEGRMLQSITIIPIK